MTSTSAAIIWEPCPRCVAIGYDGDCCRCAGEGSIRLRPVEPAPVRALSADALERATWRVRDTFIGTPYAICADAEAQAVAGMLCASVHRGRAVMERRAEKRLPGLGEKIVRVFVDALREHGENLAYWHRGDHAEPGEAVRLRKLVRELGGEE